MANRLRTRAARMLEARYHELEPLYLQHRQAAETFVHESERFTPITLAHFAAGRAALEAAWNDGLISWEDHAWLLQAYTAMMSHSVDYFSECAAGFTVDVRPPRRMLTQPVLAEAYLIAAGTCRADIESRPGDVGLFFQLAFVDNELLASPYRLDATGTILWAKHRKGLGKRRAAELEIYFEVMHILVEQFDLGLGEIADYLEQELAPQPISGQQAPDSEDQPQDEWQGW